MAEIIFSRIKKAQNILTSTRVKKPRIYEKELRRFKKAQNFLRKIKKIQEGPTKRKQVYD